MSMSRTPVSAPVPAASIQNVFSMHASKHLARVWSVPVLLCATYVSSSLPHMCSFIQHTCSMCAACIPDGCGMYSRWVWHIMLVWAALFTVTLQRYAGIFPETIKLKNIILILPVGTASVERSFSYVKFIKTCTCTSTTDQNLGRLLGIASESPELSAVNFDEVLETFKQKLEELCFGLHFLIICKRILLWVIIYNYFGHITRLIDRKLLNIKPISEISWTPRCTIDKVH